MQCIIVKQGTRCEQDSDYVPGVILPIMRPDVQVFVCTSCVDDLHFVAHDSERTRLQQHAPADVVKEFLS